jgi:hypothetical protein
MPRNVVTLAPRASLFRRKKHDEARTRIAALLAQRFRPRYREDGVIQIDFPKRYSARQAKGQVAIELDQIDRNWSRYYRLYPTEHALKLQNAGLPRTRARQ